MEQQGALGFGGLLRQLRAGTGLTQEELAEAAGLSPRGVSALERGVNRTARKDTAVLLAGALRLTGPAAELFVAAARGNVPPAEVLAAAEAAGPRPGAVADSPYRGLAVFGEQDARWFFGREAAAAQVLDRMSGLLAGTGLLVVSGASGAGRPRLLTSLVSVEAAAAAAVTLGVLAAVAYTGALPAPAQQLAHNSIGATFALPYCYPVLLASRGRGLRSRNTALVTERHPCPFRMKSRAAEGGPGHTWMKPATALSLPP